MSRSIFLRGVLLAGVALLLLAAPRVLSIVQTRMLTEIAYFALFAVSYNFLFGWAGLLSFGHAAYFGLGAYVTAISLKHVAGLHLLAGIGLGGLAAALGGAVIGFFCVRRKGSYFALLTLAFNQFLWAIAWKWREVTGGDDGIGRITPKKPVDMGLFYLDLTRIPNKYYFTMAVVVIFLAIGWYLLRTPFGNTIQAVKVNEERAAFLGYNVNRSKLLIFTLSAFYAGIAGSLFALFQGFRRHQRHRAGDVHRGALHGIPRWYWILLRPHPGSCHLRLLHGLDKQHYRALGVFPWGAFHHSGSLLSPGVHRLDPLEGEGCVCGRRMIRG
jgi:branched-chain amino acid transport system permease protein